MRGELRFADAPREETSSETDGKATSQKIGIGVRDGAHSPCLQPSHQRFDSLRHRAETRVLSIFVKDPA